MQERHKHSCVQTKFYRVLDLLFYGSVLEKTIKKITEIYIINFSSITFDKVNIYVFVCVCARVYVCVVISFM